MENEKCYLIELTTEVNNLKRRNRLFTGLITLLSTESSHK